jgi:16S rRNA (adenine1518-N6/adenine1519-N6)-dimethyltransferase
MTNPYITPGRVRAALQALELRPTRGMGQNFLVDPHALATIVEAADLQPSDVVLEIGPGLGVLTWELVARAAQVVAIELDKRLAARLQQEFAAQPRLHIVQGDVLDLPPERVLAEATGALPPYKVVANLPYAITSPVLRHLLEAAHKPHMIVVLVQWEVAQRIAAGPGDMSVLAHSVQIYATPEIVARVPASSFVPAPAVDSAVLRLHVRPQPAAIPDDVDGLMRIIKAGFLHARKKLSNALPGGVAAFGMPYTKQQVVDALRAAGVSPDRRAETVTLDEWAAVYRQLHGE